MISINLYGLMSNPHIQAEAVPIYKTLDEVIDAMYEHFKNLESVDQEKPFNFCFPFERLRDLQQRVRFFAQIHDVFPESIENQLAADDSLFQLKTYLITPAGKVLFVKNFDKVFENFKFIEEQGVKALTNGEKSLEELRDEMIAKRESFPDTKDFMIATTVLGYIYQILNNEIETHREKIQSDMMVSIKEIREKQEEEAEITNELELLNKRICDVLKDPNERMNDNFQFCYYNGEKLSQQDMADKLASHVFPQFLTQIDINTTLDDSYTIETDKLIISRTPGGKIKISRK